MNNTTYNIDKLKEFDEIDVESAIKYFADYQSYFNELDVFIKASKHYLRGYTPTVVIYNEDVNKSFLAETEKIRGTLMPLGMAGIVSTLFDLDYAAGSGGAETLSDWLLKFYAEMDNMEKLLVSARTISGITQQNAVKPIILAVDDKPELLTAVVNMLEGRFMVMAVTSGKAALKVIEKHTPDLFLLDIEMPQMDGYELAKLIRNHKRFECSPVIFLTGKNTRDHVITAIKNGGNDYILKPVDKELLLNKVQQYLERKI